MSSTLRNQSSVGEPSQHYIFKNHEGEPSQLYIFKNQETEPSQCCIFKNHDGDLSEGYIFKNHEVEILRSFSVKNNPTYQELELADTRIHADFTPTDDQGNNVEFSQERNQMNNVHLHKRPAEEIRILIDEDIHVQDFTTTLPAANKIVISYSSKEFTQRLMEITLGITGQAAISLLAYVATNSTTLSSSSLVGLHFVVAANAIGFIGTFLGMWFRKSKKQVAVSSSVVVGKIGAIAAACAIIVAMGLFLPAKPISIWFVGFACLFPAAAVAFS
ncbi:uncharacterized protein LOC132066776 [Lycium ferocissimum]|uniref:uncharacterized protein LOC132066776 n=1 Tax=Lycium ferocissimum TaxID=112874 RepID=UPI002814CAD6|nr:uncharacterized protein LOC132066776 [Lycium ferocissimum]